MTIDHAARAAEYIPVIEADDPSSSHAGTTPGSFSRASTIAPGRAGALTYASPDTPNMPVPSEQTAWDFMPDDWTLRPGFDKDYEHAEAWKPPAGFQSITQLESARCGIVTPQMQRVAERETHLSAEQVRDEVAAGRMVIPANVKHLQYELDPMVPTGLLCRCTENPRRMDEQEARRVS